MWLCWLTQIRNAEEFLKKTIHSHYYHLHLVFSLSALNSLHWNVKWKKQKIEKKRCEIIWWRSWSHHQQLQQHVRSFHCNRVFISLGKFQSALILGKQFLAANRQIDTLQEKKNKWHPKCILFIIVITLFVRFALSFRVLPFICTWGSPSTHANTHASHHWIEFE